MVNKKPSVRMNIIKELNKIKKSKESHFLFIHSKKYFRYKLLIKLFVYLNKNYLPVEIFRKDYLHYGNIVVIGLRYYGKNVKRRTNGYSKGFLIDNPDAICIYCEKNLNNYNITAEHIIPISKFGNNTKVNLIVCCRSCNFERGNDDFYTYLSRKNPKFKKVKRIFL